MWGANSDELLRIAGLLDEQSSRLESTQNALTGKLRSAPWQGPAADRYRGRWEGADRSQLKAAAGFLRSAAEELRRHAAEQAQASGAGVGPSVPAIRASAVSVGFAAGATRLRNGASPDEVAAWWSSLSQAEQKALIEAHPERIGAMDGVPGWARDRANRAVIASELARLKRERAEVERRLREGVPGWVPSGPLRNVIEGALTNEDRESDILQGKIAALEILQGLTGDQQVLLVDTSGERVKAAVSVGDIDKARHIAVTVHGLDSDVEGDLMGYLRNAHSLQQYAATDPDTAAVVWLGYEAPHLKDTFGSGSVALSQEAKAAAPELRSFLQGLDAGREGDVRMTVFGHSYGSLVTGLALAGGEHSVDAVVFQGSPGVGVASVGELGVPAGEVYVAEARRDPVADLGRFSRDPNQMQGVNVLSTEGSEGHSQYFREDSLSLYNASKVVRGESESLILDPGRSVNVGDRLMRHIRI